MLKGWSKIAASQMYAFAYAFLISQVISLIHYLLYTLHILRAFISFSGSYMNLKARKGNIGKLHIFITIFVIREDMEF